MTRTREEIGDAPLQLVVGRGHGTKHEVLVAEISWSWSLAKVVPLRSFSLCLEDGLVHLVNRGGGSSEQIFSKSCTFSKQVVACKMSCVTMRWCQALFAGGMLRFGT